MERCLGRSGLPQRLRVRQPRAEQTLPHSPALAAFGFDEPVAVEVRGLTDHLHDLTGMAAVLLPEAAAGQAPAWGVVAAMHCGSSGSIPGCPQKFSYPEPLDS